MGTRVAEVVSGPIEGGILTTIRNAKVQTFRTIRHEDFFKLTILSV